MRNLSLLFLLFCGFCSCNNSGHTKSSATDTGIAIPTDNTVPSDTDDHNKPSSDSVPLDGPPVYFQDTSQRHTK
ncbi:MAG TPA: hypothetical protein VHK91_13545 [Flavisolibacter sp.]|nr:hypothetical protein [Flavisolibacter sp.]